MVAEQTHWFVPVRNQRIFVRHTSDGTEHCRSITNFQRACSLKLADPVAVRSAGLRLQCFNAGGPPHRLQLSESSASDLLLPGGCSHEGEPRERLGLGLLHSMEIISIAKTTTWVLSLRCTPWQRCLQGSRRARPPASRPSAGTHTLAKIHVGQVILPTGQYSNYS
jgi:hypothetical protein